MVLRRGRDDRGGGADASGQTVYQMRQKMFSIGDDFWIENDRGQRVFKVDGKALRVAQHPDLETPAGNELLQDPGAPADRPRHDGDRRTAGASVATVNKALISPLRER